jgi:hypothetical protein
LRSSKGSELIDTIGTALRAIAARSAGTPDATATTAHLEDPA